MLGTSHRYNTKYYTPLVGAMNVFLAHVAAHAEKYQKDPRGAETVRLERLTFFYLARFRRHNYQMIRAIGGVYFKNKTGELLVSHCLNSFRVIYFGPEPAVPLANFSAVVANVRVDESFEEFLLKLKGSPTMDAAVRTAFRNSWRYFRAWIRSNACADACAYLKAVQAVFDYEMDRPYEYWYGKPLRLKTTRDANKFLKKIAPELGPKEHSEELSRDVAAYLIEGTGDD